MGRDDVYDLFQNGTRLLEERDFHAAAVPLARARDLEPDKTSIREALGRALFGVAALRARPRAEFEAVVERAPTNDYALFCLGRSLQQLGRHAEARKPLALACCLRPERADYRRTATGSRARRGPERVPLDLTAPSSRYPVAPEMRTGLSAAALVVACGGLIAPAAHAATATIPLFKDLTYKAWPGEINQATLNWTAPRDDRRHRALLIIGCLPLGLNRVSCLPPRPVSVAAATRRATRP